MVVLLLAQNLVAGLGAVAHLAGGRANQLLGAVLRALDQARRVGRLDRSGSGQEKPDNDGTGVDDTTCLDVARWPIPAQVADRPKGQVPAPA